ncbi:MAG: hypothetical protein EAY75_02795 [Bacteroidetes bacterium]|nr:MAG: hypothetical protein EAY75_02795 [Bacteroidota bacterium]
MQQAVNQAANLETLDTALTNATANYGAIQRHSYDVEDIRILIKAIKLRQQPSQQAVDAAAAIIALLPPMPQAKTSAAVRSYLKQRKPHCAQLKQLGYPAPTHDEPQMATYIAMGLPIGVGVGVFLKNIAIGISLGPVFGLALYGLANARNIHKNKHLEQH